MEILMPELSLIIAFTSGLILGLIILGLIISRHRQQQAFDQQLHQQKEQQSQQRIADMQVEINRLAALQSELNQSREQLAALRAQSQQQLHAADEKLQLLTDARKSLTQEFELLSQKIFEEKARIFTESSQLSMDNTLKPLREQLGDFRKRVDEVYDKENRERAVLANELQQLKQLNQQMSEDAVNLTRALKGDNKTQGNWGEVILERVLEESGLHKGREYETQASFKDSRDEGKQRLQPDVIVHLPEGKDIVIDAKVSLLHYERYCSSIDDAERQAALRQHVTSLRQHIQLLAGKKYDDLDNLRSLDFVLLFVPVEAAFMAALEADSQLFREAYDKNIIIVSPTTLLATLRTIHSIWRYERQNRNADEIALEAGRLHDQFVLVLESLQEIDRHLIKAREAYDATVGRIRDKRGNLVGRIAKLEKLGAKARKQLPADFIADIEVDDVIDEESQDFSVSS
jgi:DNA recombination protein RmuC